MDRKAKKVYFVRVTNVQLFNALVEAAEKKSSGEGFTAERTAGFFELRSVDVHLWRDLSLYGQLLAQAQDEFFETGEEMV